MSSLTQYRELTKNAQAKDKLGVALPDLTRAKVNVITQQYDVSDLQAVVEVFAPDAGWVVYRDGVEITNQAPNRSDVIEAEYYCQAADVQSIKIKHLFAKQYLVTRFEVIDEESDEYCYSEQAVIVRKNLAEQAQTAHYRLWYKQDDAFRWNPFAQQFIGFNAAGEQKENK
ncbi:hypothetical protein D1115_06490 [Vibrio alfacsensis]|uniref:Phage tail protein n=1 Tax=Vibrio alfacsensis TaxID=1074311 RepID=A0ABM6YTI0_9VIBR|nr:hypothetical protein [Vibrio alfacsensis]AXY00927.1 hypothetical protein D1115_06490 [Vibrio alfacsensis]